MAFGVTWNAKRDKIVRLVFATLFVWDDVVNDHPCLNIISRRALFLLMLFAMISLQTLRYFSPMLLRFLLPLASLGDFVAMLFSLLIPFLWHRASPIPFYSCEIKRPRLSRRLLATDSGLHLAIHILQPTE